ncbi:hypothetical protein PWT90_09721 [Aphanocladium album]|nr:hypothetical protein PWT90_09721 [Aphanocladium album]
MSYSIIITAAAGLLLITYFLYLAALPCPLPGIPYNVAAAKSIWGDGKSLIRELKTTNDFPRWLGDQVNMSQSPIKQIFLAPFGKPVVLLADYREARDMTVHRTKEFDRASRVATIFGPLAPKTQFTLQTGHEWKRHRQLLQDTMTPSFLREVAAPNIYDSGLRLVRLWGMKTRIACGRPFEANEDIYHTALDAVLAFTFGPEFPHSALAPATTALATAHDYDVTEGLSADDAVHFHQFDLEDELEAMLGLVAYLNKVQGHPMPSLAWRYYKNTPTFKRLMKTKADCIRREIQRAVDDRLKRDKVAGQEPQLCHAVGHVVDREHRDSQKAERKPDFFSQMIFDELLADHAEVQSRLRIALHRGFHSAHVEKRMPTAQEIMSTSIPYLDAVMEELLRVGNASALGAREALCDTTIMGCRIPKGTTVIYRTVGHGLLEPSFEVDENLRTPTSQRDQQTGKTPAWHNATITMFRPERWLKHQSTMETQQGASVDEKSSAAEVMWDDPSATFDSNAGPINTFGKGPRSCFGRRLAYVEFKILLTLIIWNFELEKCPKKLSSYQATLGLVYKARQCFVRLQQAAEIVEI